MYQNIQNFFSDSKLIHRKIKTFDMIFQIRLFDRLPLSVLIGSHLIKKYCTELFI